MVAMTHEIVQIDEDYKNLKDFKWPRKGLVLFIVSLFFLIVAPLYKPWLSLFRFLFRLVVSSKLSK